MRFHLDESVDGNVGRGLRRRGIDVTTPVEVGLRGASDLDHIAFALANDRVIVTCDADFADMHWDGVAHAGIIYCKASCTIGAIFEYVEIVNECSTPEELRGQLEFA
jgi:hypothetical protein